MVHVTGGFPLRTPVAHPIHPSASGTPMKAARLNGLQPPEKVDRSGNKTHPLQSPSISLVPKVEVGILTVIKSLYVWMDVRLMVLGTFPFGPK